MFSPTDIQYEIIRKIEEGFGLTVIRSELHLESNGRYMLYLVYDGLLNCCQLEELFKLAHMEKTNVGRLPAVQTNCLTPAGAYSLTLSLCNLDRVC